MPEIDNKKLREELQEVYQDYLVGKRKEIIPKAKQIFLDYSNTEDFLDKEIYSAVMYLETIGWNLEPPISEENAKEILKELKKSE